MATNRENETSKYELTIKTSNKQSLSTFGISYFVKLYGGGKETEFVKLKSRPCLFFPSYFKPGGTGKWVIETTDVGIPDYIELKKTKPDKPWFCETVTVKKSSEEESDWSKTYPVYSIITENYFVFSDISRLPQNAGETKLAREAELKKIKKIIRWTENKEYAAGQLRFIGAKDYSDLPLDLQKSTIRFSDFIKFGLKGVIPTQIKDLLSSVTDVDELSDYHKIHKFLDKNGGQQTKDFLVGWDTDEGMGKQILTSAASFLLKECKELPSYFNLTDEDLKECLPEGATIKSEIKAGKLYLSDLTEFYKEGQGLEYTKLENGEPCKVSPAVCLFYINDLMKFVPIAIQLKPNDREYLFTSDGSLKWLLAKMYYRNATFSVYEWIIHYLMTHASIEAFQVGIFRNLSQAHPIYKLLRPHVRTVASMGELARALLLPKSSIMAPGISCDAISMVKMHYKTYNIEDLHMPKMFEKHGVDPQKIPGFFYGQYTLEIWKIVESHITDIVNLYYKSNEDVLDDTEIQNFANDMAHNAYGWEDGNFRGMPEKIETKEKLIEICTIIIATSSAQHSAVNFSQYETYKFAPNCPSIMRMDPPKNTDEVDMKRVLDSLPSIDQTSAVVGIVYALSKYSEVEVYLNDESRKTQNRVGEIWFYGEEENKLIEKYQDQLKVLDEDMRLTNTKIIIEYKYLQPSMVPKSIAI